jgi:hypothetical protein
MARVARFVLIVWTVAVCFRGLMAGASTALAAAGIVVGAPSPSGGECAAVVASLQPPAAPVPWALASFQLGFRTGIGIAVRNLVHGPEEADSQVSQLAGILGVPTPRFPPVRHEVEQMIEFANFAETDPQCTAARLAKLFGPRSDALYRFGLFAGYEVTFRYATMGAQTAYAPELSTYATRAGLPAELVAPLLTEPATKVREDIQRADTLAMANINAYLNATDQVPSPAATP